MDIKLLPESTQAWLRKQSAEIDENDAVEDGILVKLVNAWLQAKPQDQWKQVELGHVIAITNLCLPVAQAVYQHIQSDAQAVEGKQTFNQFLLTLKMGAEVRDCVKQAQTIFKMALLEYAFVHGSRYSAHFKQLSKITSIAIAQHELRIAQQVYAIQVEEAAILAGEREKSSDGDKQVKKTPMTLDEARLWIRRIMLDAAKIDLQADEIFLNKQISKRDEPIRSLTGEQAPERLQQSSKINSVEDAQGYVTNAHKNLCDKIDKYFNIFSDVAGSNQKLALIAKIAAIEEDPAVDNNQTFATIAHRQVYNVFHTYFELNKKLDRQQEKDSNDLTQLAPFKELIENLRLSDLFMMLEFYGLNLSGYEEPSTNNLLAILKAQVDGGFYRDHVLCHVIVKWLTADNNSDNEKQVQDLIQAMLLFKERCGDLCDSNARTIVKNYLAERVMMENDGNLRYDFKTDYINNIAQKNVAESATGLFKIKDAKKKASALGNAGTWALLEEEMEKFRQPSNTSQSNNNMPATPHSVISTTRSVQAPRSNNSVTNSVVGNNNNNSNTPRTPCSPYGSSFSIHNDDDGNDGRESPSFPALLTSSRTHDFVETSVGTGGGARKPIINNRKTGFVPITNTGNSENNTNRKTRSPSPSSSAGNW